jgi:hypothetical protein
MSTEGGWAVSRIEEVLTMPFPEVPRTCSDCGRLVEDLTQPCLNCGSPRRNAHIDIKEWFAAIDGIVSIKAERGADRFWTEKWVTVRKQLERVENACTPASFKDEDDVIRAFDSFFVDCIHLGDWIWNDRRTGFTEAEVRAYIKNDPDLTLCRAAANTGKHHTRSDPKAKTAWIESIDWSPTAIEVSVHWSAGSASGTTDALALARRCVDAWDRMLKSKGLSYQI